MSSASKEVSILKRLMWSNLVLGLWLMVSPFVLAILNLRVLQVLWEDLILGFGIATFSLCRLFIALYFITLDVNFLLVPAMIAEVERPVLIGCGLADQLRRGAILSASTRWGERHHSKQNNGNMSYQLLDSQRVFRVLTLTLFSESIG